MDMQLIIAANKKTANYLNENLFELVIYIIRYTSVEQLKIWIFHKYMDVDHGRRFNFNVNILHENGR